MVILQRENAADHHYYKEVIRTAEEAGLPLVILAEGTERATLRSFLRSWKSAVQQQF